MKLFLLNKNLLYPRRIDIYEIVFITLCQLDLFCHQKLHGVNNERTLQCTLKHFMVHNERDIFILGKLLIWFISWVQIFSATN